MDLYMHSECSRAFPRRRHADTMDLVSAYCDQAPLCHAQRRRRCRDLPQRIFKWDLTKKPRRWDNVYQRLVRMHIPYACEAICAQWPSMAKRVSRPCVASCALGTTTVHYLAPPDWFWMRERSLSLVVRVEMKHKVCARSSELFADSTYPDPDRSPKKKRGALWVCVCVCICGCCAHR